MATYTIHYSGTVEIQAESEEAAMLAAWEQEGVHSEDIQTITKN